MGAITRFSGMQQKRMLMMLWMLVAIKVMIVSGATAEVGEYGEWVETINYWDWPGDPDVLEWDIVDGISVAELEYDLFNVKANIMGSSHQNMTMKGFNGNIPGPTLIFERCKTYNLTVTNNLNASDYVYDYNCTNCYKDPQFINLHFHVL
jgi:hypothetical protein